jgi:hypothetical protein
MNDRSTDPLDRRLHDLPREIPPPRDLWPEISARLARGAPPLISPAGPSHGTLQPGARARRPRVLPLAVAAALVGACIAGTLTWAVMHGRADAPQRAAVFSEPRDRGYLAARATLEVGFRQQLEQLDPATRARIEASLAVIRQAREDIRKALANEPGSPVLEQLWQSTLRDEFDLYDRVSRGTQTAVTRT